MLNFIGLVAISAMGEYAHSQPASSNKPSRITLPERDILNRDIKAVDVLTALMVGEARGEDRIGQLCVGEVLLNRVASKRYPNSVMGAAFQPWQFSCFNRDYSEAPKLLRLAQGLSSGRPQLDMAFQDIRPRAELLLSGFRTGLLTPTTLHYYAHDLVEPIWKSAGRLQLRHGGHSFLADVP